jgi:hypothetical protein
MDRTTQDIKDQLQALAKQYGPAALIPATVIDVHDDDTITVQLATGLELDDVRLRSVVKAGSKIILLPKVESVVQMARIENSEEFVVVAVEEITEIRIEIGNVKYVIDQDGLLIQKETDTVREVLQLIIEAVQKIIVLQGTNPDRVKLQQALTKAQNIFK